MSAITKIVCGGGWKGTHVEKIKVKAWLSFLLSVAFGAGAVYAEGSPWTFLIVPSVLLLFLSLALFIIERPRAVEWPISRSGHDPKKLYGVSGTCRPKPKDDNGEPAG